MHKISPFQGATPAGIARFQAARLRRVLDSKVKIAAGSDMYLDLRIPQGEAARRVLFAYRDAGMPASEVLRAATLHAAELLGEKRLGVLEPGAFADILAVRGDPLEHLEVLQQPVLVMKAGKVFREFPGR
jgi:imidazolonepropionase-like amidohydrolase